MNSFKQEKKNVQCLWEVLGLGKFAINFFSPSAPISGCGKVCDENCHDSITKS